MGGSASEEFLAKAENGEDTYVRCTNCDYAANVEAVRVPRARSGRVRRRAGCARRGHARTRPTIETLVDHLNAALPARRPPLDRRRHAEERRRHARPPRRHARAARDRGAGRPRRRPQAARGAGRAGRGVEPFDEADFAQAPDAGQGLHRAAARSASEAPAASATCSTRASSTARAGSPAPTRPAATSSTWSPGATSTATA